MAAMTKTITKRVEEYVLTTGETLATAVASLHDIAQKAVLDMMKSLPADLVIPHITKIDGTGSTYNLADLNTHVYAVYIDDHAAPVTYVSPDNFARAGLTGNYQVTSLDPIYTINRNSSNARLQVLPGSLAFDIYAYSPTTIDCDADILGTSTSVNEVPMIAHEAIILDISIKVLYTKLNDLVQNEEDPEMATVITNQIQSLQSLYQFELQKILGAPQEAAQ